MTRRAPSIAAWLHTAGILCMALSVASGLAMPALKSDTLAPPILRLHVSCGLGSLAVVLARILSHRGLTVLHVRLLRRTR